MKRLLTILASSAALAGCATVGPDYETELPRATSQAALHASAQDPFVPEAPPEDWWRLYDDPRLDGLVAEALAANTDLRIAAANLAQARGALREVRAGRSVSTTVSGGTAQPKCSAW